MAAERPLFQAHASLTPEWNPARAHVLIVGVLVWARCHVRLLPRAPTVQSMNLSHTQLLTLDRLCSPSQFSRRLPGLFGSNGSTATCTPTWTARRRIAPTRRWPRCCERPVFRRATFRCSRTPRPRSPICAPPMRYATIGVSESFRQSHRLLFGLIRRCWSSLRVFCKFTISLWIPLDHFISEFVRVTPTKPGDCARVRAGRHVHFLFLRPRHLGFSHGSALFRQL